MDEREQEANRILEKADASAASGDYAEAGRLMVLADCLWPADPVQRAIDQIERDGLVGKYATRPLNSLRKERHDADA